MVVPCVRGRKRLCGCTQVEGGSWTHRLHEVTAGEHGGTKVGIVYDVAALHPSRTIVAVGHWAECDLKGLRERVANTCKQHLDCRGQRLKSSTRVFECTGLLDVLTVVAQLCGNGGPCG